MADNKKGFVLYADLIHTVSELPDNIKGKLFQLILDYVNDLNPEPEDLILKVAFSPIKLQLKRDLKGWESKIKQRSEAGRASVKARSTKSTSVESRSTKSTDIVNVTDTVTVTVNDNVNVKNKNICVPDEFMFLEYCKEILNSRYNDLEFNLRAKYEGWVDQGWKDGYGKPIKNWKAKIKNTIPHLKPMPKDNKSTQLTPFNIIQASEQAKKIMGL